MKHLLAVLLACLPLCGWAQSTALCNEQHVECDKQLKSPGDADLSGKWLVTQICQWGTARDVVMIKKQGPAMYAIAGSLANFTIKEGGIVGTQVSFVASSWFNGATFVGVVNDQDTMSGTYTQRAKADVCRWTADRQ